MDGSKMGMKTQVKAVVTQPGNACRDYACPGGRSVGRQERIDWGREREKMREALLPFVRETVQKQMKEEREYYRSRPSQAVRRLESIFGAGRMEQTLVPMLSRQVYDRVEERVRQEWVRKGR